MNELAIKTEDHAALHLVAETVPEGDDVTDLVVQMWALMYRGRGIGLAANQVGVLKRVIVVNAGGFRQAIINPVITRSYGGKEKKSEGCLSFPGESRLVNRSLCISIEGFTPQWKRIKRKLSGISARCVQHEIDHLNGVTIIDGISGDSQ